MSYEISAKIQKVLEDILALEAVQKALKFIEEDAEATVAEQIEITKVESPTFFEKERAEGYANRLKALGLDKVYLDEFGNAIGHKRGTSNRLNILVDAHLDTVFPFGTVKEVRTEKGIVYAPGICDDTRGLAVNLGVIRALNYSGLKTKENVMVVGTVEEEGIGGFGGMKKLLSVNKDIDACICVDGFEAYGIVYQATGVKTMEVTFKGIGGHAYLAFGKVANPLHAAARAVAKIADFIVPANPNTTFSVSNFHGGNDAGIHSIVSEASIKLNIRSNSQKELDKLAYKVISAVKEACDEESKRWNKDTITFDYKMLVDVPAGDQDIHAPIVEALYAIIKYLGYEPKFAEGGSTNANNAIGAGIPALCLGVGETDNKTHTLEEFFPKANSHELVQETFLLMLMLAGIENVTDSIL